MLSEMNAMEIVFFQSLLLKTCPSKIALGRKHFTAKEFEPYGRFIHLEPSFDCVFLFETAEPMGKWQNALAQWLLNLFHSNTP